MSYSLQDRLLKQSPVPNPAQAVATYSDIVLTQPDSAAACADLGVSLRVSGSLPAAIALYRRALALAPDSPTVLSNLGGALRARGDLDEAISILDRSMRLSSDFTPGLFNLGLVLEDAGRLPEALACYDRVLSLEPGRKDAMAQKAFTLLRMGNFEAGFRQYESRLQFEPLLNRGFNQPVWDGSSFTGKTLLLYAEQGRGDTFQFIRYASLASSLGGTVIVECQPETAAVVEQVEGVDRVIPRGSRLPHFDYHASLMSLPFTFKTTIETIPASLPYLSVPPSALNSVKLSPTRQLKVGIAWSSGHEDVGAHERSIPLEHFLRLLELPDVALYSLQVGPAVTDLAAAGVQHLIPDLGSAFNDFSHTADAIRQLDLIISVDTAIVHLAGGMAKPVWVLLPYASEWRWLQHRADTPWYQTTRLFRQSRPMQWADVFVRLIGNLDAYP